MWWETSRGLDLDSDSISISISVLLGSLLVFLAMILRLRKSLIETLWQEVVVRGAERSRDMGSIRLFLLFLEIEEEGDRWKGK